MFWWKLELIFFNELEESLIWKLEELGIKNFAIEYILIGIVISVALVHVGFIFLGKFLKTKFTEKQLHLAKNFFEYSLIAWVLYYFFY